MAAGGAVSVPRGLHPVALAGSARQVGPRCLASRMADPQHAWDRRARRLTRPAAVARLRRPGDPPLSRERKQERVRLPVRLNGQQPRVCGHLVHCGDRLGTRGVQILAGAVAPGHRGQRGQHLPLPPRQGRHMRHRMTVPPGTPGPRRTSGLVRSIRRCGRRSDALDLDLLRPTGAGPPSITRRRSSWRIDIIPRHSRNAELAPFRADGRGESQRGLRQRSRLLTAVAKKSGLSWLRYARGQLVDRIRSTNCSDEGRDRCSRSCDSAHPDSWPSCR